MSAGTGKLWICNLVGMKAVKGGPPLMIDAVDKTLNKLSRFAAKEEASVHMAEPHPLIKNLDWPKLEYLLKKHLRDSGPCL